MFLCFIVLIVWTCIRIIYSEIRLFSCKCVQWNSSLVAHLHSSGHPTRRRICSSSSSSSSGTHTHTRTLDRRVIQWTDRINSARKYPSTRHDGPFPRNTTDSDECWTIPPTLTLVPRKSAADAAPVLQCSMTLTLTLGQERHLCRVAGDTVWSHMACEYS